ncbi:MAG: translocation/assembly module TamB domain-containing protein, partial [Vulcanimicrobiaceae bacterium]
YVSDLQRTPITDTVATIVFSNQRGELKHFSSHLGNGTLDATGHIAFGSSGNAVFALDATARNAQLDFPAYGSGTVNGKISLERQAQHDTLLSGKLTLDDTTVLFSALAAAASGKQGGGSGTPALPFNMGLDLDLNAGNNVRVRGGSGFGAGLDIGATGSLAIAGTLRSPTLEGTIASTGGTLTYFDRAFRVRSGTVVFRPEDGLIPTMHAVATTNVVNPDPDPRRNPFGTADVTITVEGRIDALSIDLKSDPPGYSQEQILALIAPFGGFVAPIAFDSAGPYQRTGNQITVGQEAFNILNAQFSSALLSPLESALGRGLGLSDVNLTLSYYGNVGLSARRVLGRNVTFTFSQTFGIPSFQSFGFIYNQGGLNSAQLSFFNQTGASRLTDQNKAQVYPGLPLAIGQPDGEGSGFSFTYQRFFR